MNATVEILGFTREPGWLPWAVQYFFLIGISTAAFVVSLPGLAWRLPAWRGISRRALLAALVFGLAAPVALLADLHQPGRFLNFYLHPNFGSWMAWGAFFIPLYLLGLIVYAWLCLRPSLAVLAGRGGARARLYGALAYGGHQSLGALRGAAVLTGLGAALVLLYTGMEVMVVQARALWHSPLLPVFFAVTALAAGLGATGLFEALLGDRAAAPRLNRWLALSQWAVLAVLAAWLATGVLAPATMAGQALAAIGGALGWQLTLAWLLATTALTLWLARRRPGTLLLPALLALHGAWLARWIVFMGGQSIPKMGAAFHDYALGPGADGLLGIIGSAGLCLVIYIVLTSFVPWDEPADVRGVQS